MAKKSRTSKNGRANKNGCTVTLTEIELSHLQDLLTLERHETSRWMLDENDYGVRTGHAAALLRNTTIAAELHDAVQKAWDRKSRTA